MQRSSSNATAETKFRLQGVFEVAALCKRLFIRQTLYCIILYLTIYKQGCYLRRVRSSQVVSVLDCQS